MEGKTGERRQELCEQAANEKDPAKMLEIVEELNRVLDAKYNHISHKDGAPEESTN
jgi:hypothetical protein